MENTEQNKKIPAPPSLFIIICGALSAFFCWIEWWWLGGLILGVMFGVLFTLDRLFYALMGRKPTEGDSDNMILKLFSRRK
jgi:hypothetical protein